ETELTGEEVITGYVSLIQQTYDEKQLEILARITQMNCDHESIDNKWLKLDENFDIESIIAIEATKKWRELQDSMKESEGEEEAPEETESPDGEEADEAPVEEAPVEEAPVEEAPVEEAPVEEAPAEEAPAEEAPAEEAPAEEAPAEEAPVEE
ncbi:MAG: hypothetical protein IJM71_03110, partial [Clostridia bacterium]|nr:hypothetical protein [Clostridia bacterium]